MKKVLILGGGFAGIQAAIELQKANIFEVTIVSDRNYLYIYPISIWVPVRIKEFDDVKVSLFNIKKKYAFNVIIDKVLEINSSRKRVFCENNLLEYDYLVIAIGAEKLDHKGLENTLSICGKPEMSIDIRDKLDALMTKGKGRIAIGFGGNPKDKSAVRGGPAFELMFNIHNTLKKKKIREYFDLTFFAPMDEPGARMGKDSMVIIEKMFRKYNINKHFGKKIIEFRENNIIFEGDKNIETDLILFIPGLTGHSILNKSDLPLTDAGFIKIDDTGLVENTENVYAIGDVAAIQGFEWIAKQGHLAELMGRNAAYNIIKTENKSKLRKGYADHLNILCVMDTGNGAAFVFRNDKRAYMIPLPIIGHWLKQAWGYYSKLSKVGGFPRLPGL